MTLVRSVVSRSVAKTFQSSVFPRAVQREVRRFLAEPHFTNDMATRIIDLQVFTNPVTKFDKDEIDRCSFEKSKVYRYRIVSKKVFVGHKKAEDEFPTQKMDSARSPSLSMEISDDAKTSTKADSTFTTWHKSDIRCHCRRHQGKEERVPS